MKPQRVIVLAPEPASAASRPPAEPPAKTRDPVGPWLLAALLASCALWLAALVLVTSVLP